MNTNFFLKWLLWLHLMPSKCSTSQADLYSPTSLPSSCWAEVPWLTLGILGQKWLPSLVSIPLLLLNVRREIVHTPTHQELGEIKSPCITELKEENSFSVSARVSEGTTFQCSPVIFPWIYLAVIQSIRSSRKDWPAVTDPKHF